MLGLAWIVFPVALGLLSLGCGLVLQRVKGGWLAEPLLLPAGFALIVVVGSLATATEATASLATPAVVVLAIIGVGLSWPWRRPTEPSAYTGAGGAFAVYAAPIVLSGQATFAGYIELDDTATWLSISNRTIEHGRPRRARAVELRGDAQPVHRNRRLPRRFGRPPRSRAPDSRDRLGVALPAVHGVPGGTARARRLHHGRRTAPVYMAASRRRVRRRPGRSPVRLLPLGIRQGAGDRAADRAACHAGGRAGPRPGTRHDCRSRRNHRRRAAGDPERRCRRVARSRRASRAAPLAARAVALLPRQSSGSDVRRLPADPPPLSTSFQAAATTRSGSVEPTLRESSATSRSAVRINPAPNRTARRSRGWHRSRRATTAGSRRSGARRR
jgi:hypothetical protein